MGGSGQMRAEAECGMLRCAWQGGREGGRKREAFFYEGDLGGGAKKREWGVGYVWMWGVWCGVGCGLSLGFGGEERWGRVGGITGL